MNARDNVIAKIQKLFVMAEKGFGNEADIAMKKALELMGEHGINQSEVNLVSIELPPVRRLERWISMLFHLCCKFSGVVSILSIARDRRLVMYGDEIGVNVAYFEAGKTSAVNISINRQAGTDAPTGFLT